MEYAVFKQQIMEQAKRILPQEEGYVKCYNKVVTEVANKI